MENRLTHWESLTSKTEQQNKKIDKKIEQIVLFRKNKQNDSERIKEKRLAQLLETNTKRQEIN